MSKQTKDWCFTDYGNFDERVVVYSECTDIKYVIFQEEKCPETGRLHLQGFLQLEKKKRLRGVKNLVGDSVHLEPRKGTVRDAIAYCRKSETATGRTWTKGKPCGQGKRGDLENIQKMVLAGCSYEQIWDENFTSATGAYKAIREYKRLKTIKRRWEMECWLLWGATGTGKTRFVHDREPDVYVKLGGKWFDGYDDHEAVLFDDYTGQLELGLFLQVLDRYPLQVEVKGGSVQFVAKRVYVTSNLSPELWYPEATPEQHAAIRRRFKHIKNFKALGDGESKGE